MPGANSGRPSPAPKTSSLDDESDAQMVLKAAHAITSASTAYAKLVEIGEIEARLEAVEQLLKERRNGHAQSPMTVHHR